MKITDYIVTFVSYMFYFRKTTYKTILNQAQQLYNFHIYLLSEFWPDYVLSNILNQETVNKIIQTLALNLKPSVCSSRISAISNLCDVLFLRSEIKEKIIFERPRHVEKQTIKFVDTNQLQDIINYINKDNLDIRRIRNLIAVELLYKTWLRASEAIQVWIDDIIGKNVLYIIWKGNKERQIYIPESLKKLAIEFKALRDEREFSSKALLISTITWDPLLPIALYKLMKRIWENVWIKLHPHMFRHTYASILVKNGVEVQVARDLLGHWHKTNSNVYFHSFKDDRELVSRNIFW